MAVLKRHVELFGAAPSTKDFLEYFNPVHIGLTVEMLRDSVSNADAASIRSALIAKNMIDPKTGPVLHRYFSWKNRQSEFTSWLSSDNNLRLITEMCVGERIHVVDGDITEIPMVWDEIKQKNKKIGLVYLSNVRDYAPDLDRIFSTMPISNNAVIVETTIVPDRNDWKYPKSVLDDPYMSANKGAFLYIVRDLKDAKQPAKGRSLKKRISLELQNGMVAGMSVDKNGVVVIRHDAQRD